MVVINPAVAAQYTLGVRVHRNLVTKSHKTLVAANRAVKYEAGVLVSTPIQSPVLHSLVTKRSDTRIMAANPAVVSSSNLTGVQFYTQCQLQNHSGQNATLDGSKYWHGYGEAPETIFQAQTAGEFKHFRDSIGSIGAVSYLLGDKVRWIIAWSNSGEDQLKLNKVYSEILEVTERGVDWGRIRDTLDQCVSQYKAKNREYGFSSDVMIDPTNPTPTMTATLNLYT